MVRQLTSLSVFVASPDDVADERVRLEEVIRELNVTWSKMLGVHVDLIRWETHAFPGFGEDAQDVINSQMPNDYDIFIGIMWCRFGTPTNRAGAGTAEEFARAKERHSRDSSSVRLMFYFKDAPVSPSKLDPEQLAKVNAFRKSIGDDGGLYSTFSDIDQFESLTRIHLARQVQDYVAHNNIVRGREGRGDSASIATSHQKVISEDSDEGILDLIDTFEEGLEEMGSVSARIGEATEELAAQVTARSAEINNAKSRGDVSRGVAKRLIARVASDMEQYVNRMEAELPAFSKAVSDGLSALVKAIGISIDTETEHVSDEDVASALGAVERLKAGIKESHDRIGSFREVVVELPRLTSVLNKAKRAVADVLDRLLVEFQTADSFANEARSVILQVSEKRKQRL